MKRGFGSRTTEAREGRAEEMRGTFRALPRGFYVGDTVEIARRLLGHFLVHEGAEGLCAGRIVEAEAYLRDDPACHAVFRVPGKAERWEMRRTERNGSMFGPPGTAYVYFTYGAHHIINVVTQEEGIPEAVLLRALEPAAGVELMMKRRGVEDLERLTSGPGKLAKAMGIGPEHDGWDLTRPPLFIARGAEVVEGEIAAVPRIGIRHNTDKMWRFYLKGCRFVSRK